MNLADDVTFYHLFMSHTPNLVFVKDAQSRFLFANNALLNLFPPERRDRVVGYTTAEDFAPEEAELFLTQDKIAFASGYTEIVETLIDYQGNPRTFLSRKRAFVYQGQPCLMGISTDISDLAAREKSLAELNDRLQKFSAMAAHDLRSPLATFVSGIRVIKNDAATTLSPRSAQCLDMIAASATHLASNIGGLLDALKAEHGTGATFEEYDLNVLFEEVRFNLSSKIEQHQALLNTNRLPKTFVAPGLFRHLLQNLLENSLKYHRPAVRPRITLIYRKKAGKHTFTLEDNGIGIAAERAASVFKAYDQGTNTKADGAGLGLALCQQIIDLHHGRIAVSPGFTGGCRITFEIPTNLATRNLPLASMPAAA